MKTLNNLIATALVITSCVTGTLAAEPPKAVGEADLVKLLELNIPDDVIVKRITGGGVSFPADEEIVKRLKKAGASEAVLAAVRKSAKPAAAAVLSVWVTKEFASWDCPLQSDLTINGKPVGTYTANTDQPIAEHIKSGWNTITLKTRVQPPAEKANQLIFRLGPVTKKNDRRVMSPIWQFRNGTDWTFDDGKFTHKLGPDVREMTLTFRVYYAGREAEGHAIAAGDYVLTGQPTYASWNSPITATVFVNGHALNTVLGDARQIVITPYLKKGENVIKLVSKRVANVVAENDIKFAVAGPAEYNASRGRHEVKPITQFESMQGWKRNEKSGQLENQTKAGADTVEREIKFTLDQEPGKK